MEGFPLSLAVNGREHEFADRVGGYSGGQDAATGRPGTAPAAGAGVGLPNMGSPRVRGWAVEQALLGGPATPEAIRHAARHATEGTSPISDAGADIDYREHLAQVLTGRAVTAAAGV